MISQCVRQQYSTFECRFRGVYKDCVSKAQAHQSQGDFLGRSPMRAAVRWVGVQESFGIFPEGVGIFFITCEHISASQCGCPAKAPHLPGKLDILTLVLPGFILRPMLQRLVQYQFQRPRFTTEQMHPPTYDLVRLLDERIRSIP